MTRITAADVVAAVARVQRSCPATARCVAHELGGGIEISKLERVLTMLVEEGRLETSTLKTRRHPGGPFETRWVAYHVVRGRAC
jgi:hypothetical protein